MSRRIAICLSLLMLAAGCAEPAETRAPAQLVHGWYLERIDTLIARVDVLSKRSDATPVDTAALQQAFADARLAYKRIEHLAEYFSPALAETLNGPPIAEIEDDEPSQIVIPAEGFQVLEELLFPTVESTPASRQEEIAILRANLMRLRISSEATELSDPNILEATRFQLARILSLGLSGFDSPVAHNSLPEAAAALTGLRETLSFYSRSGSASTELEATLNRLDAASALLLSTTETFDTFDRLAFLTDVLMPLHRAVNEFRDAAGITPPPMATAWRASIPTPYDIDAFDASFFSQTPGESASPELVALGRALFHEPAISGSGARSCASCHNPDLAFADGLPRSLTVDGEGETQRNAPTLLNAGLQFGNFYDLRTVWLEDQIADVLASPAEMASSAEEAARRVAKLPGYQDGFRTAFAFGEGDSISAPHVQKALAAYVRSLSSLDSRFDRYVRGDKSALEASEIRGFNTFMGRAGCGTCHFVPLFSGAFPPMYSDIDLEVLGVPAHADTIKAVIDTDEGRYPLYRNPLHRFAFRTATVRNVELTAPYMHNGVYATLEDVVDFYDRGGGAGIGIELENQTLPGEPLELTDQEKADLVAFMHSLSDAGHP